MEMTPQQTPPCIRHLSFTCPTILTGRANIEQSGHWQKIKNKKSTKLIIKYCDEAVLKITQRTWGCIQNQIADNKVLWKSNKYSELWQYPQKQNHINELIGTERSRHNPTKLSRVGTKIKCSGCGRVGHNKSKCGGNPAAGNKEHANFNRAAKKRKAKKARTEVLPC